MIQNKGSGGKGENEQKICQSKGAGVRRVMRTEGVQRIWQVRAQKRMEGRNLEEGALDSLLTFSPNKEDASTFLNWG